MSDENWSNVSQLIDGVSKPRRIILFQDDSIIDAMSDLASLMTHLINADDGDYGKTLIHRMIRDTLLHLITRLQDSLPVPDTD